MRISNSGAALAFLAALAGIAASILLSQWTYVKASDGIYLGLFPLAYLLIAMFLIATTLRDKHRHQLLAGLEYLSSNGALRILGFIGATLIFAFFQQSIGSIPCLALLALISAVSMGIRSPFVLTIFSIGSAALLHGLFSLLGATLQAWP